VPKHSDVRVKYVKGQRRDAHVTKFVSDGERGTETAVFDD